ncbi:hypothetical protein BJX70DRAFT_395830 [Aspergillus crustosus]
MPRSPKGKQPIRGSGSPPNRAIPIPSTSPAASAEYSVDNKPPASMGFMMLANRAQVRPTTTNAATQWQAPRTRPTRTRKTKTNETKYTIYVGTTAPNYVENIDPHWMVILLSPTPDEDGLDCRWYHCLGSQWDETNRYRRVINERNFNNPFVARKIPVGTMSEEQMLLWNKCFKKTMPQENEFFCGRFLERLVGAGILQAYQVAQVQAEIGALPAGTEEDTEYRSGDECQAQAMPDGTSLMFRMDL